MADEKGKIGAKGNTPPVTRAEFEAGIVQKAWQDPEYKKRLLADPKKVVEEELGRYQPGAKMPENIQVHVHEETPNALHITLPVNPKDYANLSGDEWMNEVTGGCVAVAIAVFFAAVANVQAALNVNAAGNINALGNVNAAGNVNIAGNINATVNVNTM